MVQLSAMQGQDKIRVSQIVFVAVLAFFPIVSVTASYLASRTLMLAMFFLLGLMAFAGVRRTGNDRSYMLLILSFSLSLLLSSTFVSRNLSGYDIHQEYYIFSQTIAQGWHPENELVYNSVLSISILPTIIKLATGLNSVLIFEIIFPILYSIVPLMLYKVYRRFLSSQAAFLSVFLFMSYPTSYVEITALGRQEIAEIFLVILLWVFLSSGLRETTRGKIIMVLLTVGFVVSHYSLAFIYILVLVVSTLLAHISRRTRALCTNVVFVFSLLLVLSWYLLISGGSALTSLAAFALVVSTGLARELFNPISRPPVVQQVLEFSGASGVLHIVNRVVQYLVVISLPIGFVVFALRTQKNNAGRALLSPMLVGLALLISSVVLPFFAFGLNLSRTYHIALLFISPCFIYGVDQLVSLLRRTGVSMHVPTLGIVPSLRRIPVATILVLYFLFVGGWVWAISVDSPTSVVLDGQRMANSQSIGLKIAYFAEYTVAQDIYAAQWMQSHHSAGHTVCADYISSDHVLNSYGGFAKYLPRIPDECSYGSDYVYLSMFNAVNGTGTRETSSSIAGFQISDISPELASMNVIYSGGALVYLSP